MGKTLLQRIFNIFVISALTILFFACSDELKDQEQQDKAKVSFSVTNNIARTVLPQVSLDDVDHYTLLGEKNNEAETVLVESFSDTETTIILDIGTWNFTLNAYNSSGKHILQGIVQNKQINLTGYNQVSFSLSSVRSGTGSIQITLNYPGSVGITSIISTNINSDGVVDTEEFPVYSYDNFVYTKNNIEAEDYFFNFELYHGDLLKAVVSEVVLVRDNLTSSKTITLVGENLKPLPVFEITVDPTIIGIDEWELTAQSAQAVPNEDTLFTLTGTYAEYQWYLDGEPAANSSSYIFNRPIGVYELVVVVTNSNGESRSGSCRITAGVSAPTIYTVTYNVNNGSGTVPPAQAVNAGSSITILGGSGLTRSGYVFGGWNTAAAGNGTNYSVGSLYKPTGNITLYAKWNTTCTVTFSSNSGTGTAPPTRTVNAGTSITIPDRNTLTRTNYAFGGWNTSADGTGTNYEPSVSYTVTGNTTFYAKWTITAYTVSFNLNSGSGTTPSSQTATVGSSITLPNGSGLTRSGYVFGGWNTLADGTGTNYNGSASYTPAGSTQSITLYVKWTVAYTVTFNINNNSGNSAPASQTVGSGSSTTLPSTTWTDYVFDGWNTSANGTGTGYAAGSSYTPTGNITLYAQWYIFREDFEGTNSFTIVNGSEPNKWYVGTVTAHGGTKSAYISNDNGVSNAYTSTSYSGVHMYRNVKFPSSGTYTLTFYWKSMGTKYPTTPVTYFDYLAVSLIETSSTPSAGLEVIPASTLARYASDYGTVPSWNSATVNITISEQYGATKRLVFSWINTNNANNDQPPAAVDNIVVKK